MKAGSPAISPHTLTSLPELRWPRRSSAAHQLQHGRMPRVVEMRHGFVGPVDRQRVLDQVVGADRDEVEVPQEASVSISAAAGTSTIAANLDVAEGPPRIVELLPAPARARRRSALTSRRCATMGTSSRTLP